jgi:PDZ domain-containing protein
MTTVSQRDHLTLWEALTLWMSGNQQLIPRDLVYPPDKSKDEIDKSNNQEFKRSEDAAAAAALGYLKYAPAVTVDTVNNDGASKGKLEEGDAIDAVNGTPVDNLKHFQDLMSKTRPGDEVALDFRRKNAAPGVTTIKLGSAPDKEQGVLGIGVVEAPWAPFTIDFNLANIGGPSACLVFSLAVIDKLTTGDLVDSKFVAGTGTITADGKVGPIGGIVHKMVAAHEAGATVFLVPAKNCYEANADNLPGLQLVKVDTLGQAVDALHTVASGGQPPSC